MNEIIQTQQSLDTLEFATMIKMVAGEKGAALSIVPGDKEAPIEAKAAALVMSTMMGLGPTGYQVYQVQGRWVVEPHYKSIITLAQRKASFRVEYFRENAADYLSSEQLTDKAIAVRCKIWRNDEISETLRLRKEALAAGVSVDQLDKIGLAVKPTAEAVGIFYGPRMRKYKNGDWKSDNLPNTWTPEDVARKRALKKALRMAFGEMAVPPTVGLIDSADDTDGNGVKIDVIDGALPALPAPKYPPEVMMKVMAEWGNKWKNLDDDQREYLFEKEMRARAEAERLAAMTPEERDAEIEARASIARAELGGNRKKRLGEPIFAEKEPIVKEQDEPEDHDLAAIREASAENMADAPTDFIIWFRERAKDEKSAVVSQGWQKSIRGKLSELANGDREQIIRFLSRITGREIKSSNDLKAGEWAALKAWLNIVNVTGDDGKRMWIIGNKDAKFTFASHSTK